MPRIGFDGRDLLRKRTGVVNNTLFLARELTETHPLEVTVYADTRSDGNSEAPPPGVRLRPLRAPPVVWKHLALPMALARDRQDVFHSPTGTLPEPARPVECVVRPRV